MEDKMIQVPEWVVNKVLSTLELSHKSITEECCLKRQIASAYNYMKAYRDGKTSGIDLQHIAVNYIDGRIEQ